MPNYRMPRETCTMIVYLANGEVEAFRRNGVDHVDGFAFEWEHEDVVHLHVNRPAHGFGREHKCLFSTLISSRENAPSDVDYFVHIDATSGPTAFRRDAGGWEEMPLSFIPSKEDLYSRNKGILEIGVLEKKRVMIVGLGSFGSQISIELAKAGVGCFSLWDFDRVELHNLARHSCTTKDLGRLKTDAILDAIKGKNPYATVDTYAFDINEHIDLMEAEIDRSDLVICATDNNLSRMNLSKALLRHNKVCIFGRAVTRAEGGDVFRYRPGGACYCCLIGNGWFDRGAEEITTVNDPRIPAYASDPHALVQVGLSADIEPICNLMVKLSLVELSRGTDSGLKDLEKELVFDYYMWANRRERRYKNWVPMPTAGNKPTILRWYGAMIQRDGGCALCAEDRVILDEGDAIPQFDNGDTSDINVNLEI